METTSKEARMNEVVEKLEQTVINMPVSISAKRLMDVLTGAVEGGSNYWARISKYNYPEGKSREDYSYPHIELPFDGGSITFEDAEEQEGFEPTDLTYDKLQNGLKVMAEKYDWHFKNIVDENDDAETSDVLLQCALFGQITFG
jgi:hypothetical protein